MRNYMKRISFFAWGVVSLFISSCAIIENTDRPNLDKITKTNYRKIEGTYNNASNDSTIKVVNEVTKSLWFQIGYENWRDTNWNNQRVVLKFVTDKKIIAELYQNGELINHKTIKGKIKDGYFYRRPFFIVIPFIPLVFGYNTHRYRIGLIDNNLIVDNKENFWVFAIAAGNTENKQTTLTYDKK